MSAANCLTELRSQEAAKYRVFVYNLPMTRDDEKRIAAFNAKTLETMCVITQALTCSATIWPPVGISNLEVS